jgi:hypothetical protein
VGSSGAEGRTFEVIELDDTARAVLSMTLLALPLLLTLWALLDCARRPEWAWALAGRRRVVWMAAILFGAMTVILGLAVSSIYLIRIRPAVAAAESGKIQDR